ncbi:hypothetical protein [Streptomyces sp. NBC_00063]|uniref:hypothetical protein n=1 Tax=Streptomyces sp. NBC_00063 TaxID=2975638 RepID=UPI003D71C4D5
MAPLAGPCTPNAADAARDRRASVCRTGVEGGAASRVGGRCVSRFVGVAQRGCSSMQVITA